MNMVYFECSDERAKEIMEAVQFDPDPDDEENTGFGTLDFNKLIPMPPSLMLEAGSSTEQGIEIYLTAVNPNTKDYNLSKMPEDKFKKLVSDLNAERRFTVYKPSLSDDEIQKYTMYSSFGKLADTGKQAINNLLNYGATTWYDWCIKNWGTKWNSYDTWKSEENGFQFSTAWSAPHPVIEALARKYPDVFITHEWADEDIGHNCGMREYENGECTYEYEPPTRKDAIEYATRVWGDSPQDYGLAINGTGTEYININAKEYELIELFGKPALFTSERLTKADIPADLYLSHVRGDDETTGGFAALEPRVLVNHFGSIVTKEPICFGKKGYIEFTDETEPKFTGRSISFSEYMYRTPSLTQTSGMSLM
jgi:hypothetical protein